MANNETNFQSTYIKAQSILLCLLPFSLILSIFVTDLIVVILFFSFLFNCYKNDEFQTFNNIYFKYFFVYWIYITLLSFLSDNFFVSFKSSFTHIRFIVLPLIVYYSIRKDKSFIKNFLYSIIIAFLILIIDSFYEFFVGKNIMGYGNLEKGRLVSFFKDEYILGSYMSKLFFLIASIWFFIFNNKNYKQNLFFGIFYILSFLIIFLSGDRMPFLLFLLGSLIFLILSEYRIKIKLAFIFITTLIIFLILSFNQTLYDRLIKKTLLELGSEKGIVEGSRIYKIESENGKEITVLTQHYNYFITSYKIFKENPIFGKGNKGFKLNCHNYKIDCCSCASHPHNTYMQLLAENGLIGFLFFFILFLRISYIFLIQFLKRIEKKNYNILSNSKLCILICVYLNLWPIAQTGNLFNNWLSIIYFLPVGFLLNEFNLKTNNTISN